MTAFVALLVLPAAALAASRLEFGNVPPHVAVVINGVLPGAGLVLLGAPFGEIAVSVLLGDAALALWMLSGSAVPPLVVGVASALWASHRSGALIEAGPAAASGPVPPPAPGGTVEPPAVRAVRPPAPAPSPDPAAEAGMAGYSVVVRCTECGADVEVPVLHHTAHCPYCGTNHLVVGHDDILQLTVPEKISGPDDVREAVLDHYRYAYYVKQYEAKVAPIQKRATVMTPDGKMQASPELMAAAEMAERRVSAAADQYRERLARSMKVEVLHDFLAPYWHGMGTLFQAAFGREPRGQEKVLAFGLAAIEASAPAFERPELPPMGRLSYLKALLPVGMRRDRKVIAAGRPKEALREAFGDVDRKKILKGLQIIGQGNLFTPDATAMVWRPWWIVRAEGEGIAETLLVDGASGRIEGPAPAITGEELETLPEEALSSGNLRFLPMECPVCGHEFPFRPDAIVHFCSNCHRAIGVDGERKVELPYDRGRVEGPEASSILPFWRFPLQLRTADGAVLTDLAHLKDGIDGTLDQIGDDAPVTRDEILVPAFHVINPRLMGTAWSRLFQLTTGTAWTVEEGRYPLTERPEPGPVTLPEPQARRIAPYYLANAFGRRDLARVRIQQVASWLFRARLESRGRLTYLAVPRQIIEPFSAYVGRFPIGALGNH